MDLNKFLSFIPGVTNPTSENNFSLVMEDSGILEVLGFWAKVKDYYAITCGEDIYYEWDMADGH